MTRAIAQRCGSHIAVCLSAVVLHRPGAITAMSAPFSRAFGRQATTVAIPARASQRKSSGIVHVEKLSPCPQREILAVSLLTLFKSFGRLPVVSRSKLLFRRMRIYTQPKKRRRSGKSVHQCCRGWLRKRPAGNVGLNPPLRRESGRKTFLPSTSYHSGMISAIKISLRQAQLFYDCFCSWDIRRIEANAG
jgi:hypothetical protein